MLDDKMLNNSVATLGTYTLRKENMGLQYKSVFYDYKKYIKITYKKK